MWVEGSGTVQTLQQSEVQRKRTLDSLGPAGGVSHVPIAPHNATGNFTKVVQRCLCAFVSIPVNLRQRN